MLQDKVFSKELIATALIAGMRQLPTQVCIKTCKKLGNPTSKPGKLPFYSTKTARDQHLLLDNDANTYPHTVIYSDFYIPIEAHTKSRKVSQHNIDQSNLNNLSHNKEP